MTHFSDFSDAANSWMDIHRSRPDEMAQLAYYRFVASRLRLMRDRPQPALRLIVPS